MGPLALGSPCFPAARAFGFEQLERAAVAGVAQRRAATRAARAHGRLARERVESRVIELARGRMETARESPDAEQAPAPRPARAFQPRGSLELGVVGSTRDLEAAAHGAPTAVRVRQLLRDHVYHAAQRVRAVQHARRPPDHLDALRTAAA